MRERSRPQHSKPPCGVAWCVDPECGVSRTLQRRSVVHDLVSELVGESLHERSARLASAPRRMATRFGLALIAALAVLFGVSALPAGTSGESPVDAGLDPLVIAQSLVD